MAKQFDIDEVLKLKIFEWNKEIKHELIGRCLLVVPVLLISALLLAGVGYFFLSKPLFLEILPNVSFALLFLAIPPILYKLPKKPSEESIQMDGVLNAISDVSRVR